MGSRLASPPFWRIVGSVFVGMLGFGAVIPVLPLYLKERLGTMFITGLLIGIASGSAIIGRLFAGRLADRKGRRIAFAVGLACCGVAGILYLPFFNVWCLALARILHGLGEGFFLTAAVAWAIDVAAPDRRAQALGFLASGVWGGLCVGPLIGQMLGSWTRVAWFVSLSSFLVLIGLRFTREGPIKAGERVKQLVPSATVLPGVILGFSNIAYAAMSGFLILLLRERGRATGAAFSAFAICVLFSRIFFGSLPDRLGPRRTLFAGFALLAVGLALIATSANLAVTVAGSAVVGLGYSFPWPSLAVIVVREVKETERASALGTLTAFYDLFVAFGATAGGALSSRLGLTSVFWMAFCSVGCAAAIAWATRIGTEPADYPEIAFEQSSV